MAIWFEQLYQLTKQSSRFSASEIADFTPGQFPISYASCVGLISSKNWVEDSQGEVVRCLL